MEVKDLSWNDVNTKRYNSRLLPRSIRGLIIGKSYTIVKRFTSIRLVRLQQLAGFWLVAFSAGVQNY